MDKFAYYMGEIWGLVVLFATSAQTNHLAQITGGFIVFMLAWKIGPSLLRLFIEEDSTIEKLVRGLAVMVFASGTAYLAAHIISSLSA